MVPKQSRTMKERKEKAEELLENIKKRKKLDSPKEIKKAAELLAEKTPHMGKKTAARKIDSVSSGRFTASRIEDIIEEEETVSRKLLSERQSNFKKVKVPQSGKEIQLSKNQLELLKKIEKRHDGERKSKRRLQKEIKKEFPEIGEAAIKKMLDKLERAEHPLINEGKVRI